MLTGKARGDNLALDPAIAKAAGHHNAINLRQFLQITPLSNSSELIQ